jgi:hypothetical protein
MTAMLEEPEKLEEYLVNFNDTIQHGGNDVTCNPRTPKICHYIHVQTCVRKLL